MRICPLLIVNSAGEWLFESEWPEWMNAIRSTCSPKCGKISETILPLSPRGENANGDCINAPTSFEKKPVNLSKPSSSLPWYLASAGRWYQVSMWLGPPLMNSQMTLFALRAKCAARGAIGLSARSGAVAATRPSS